VVWGILGAARAPGVALEGIRGGVVAFWVVLEGIWGGVVAFWVVLEGIRGVLEGTGGGVGGHLGWC
jgi:hypothetical protein